MGGIYRRIDGKITKIGETDGGIKPRYKKGGDGTGGSAPSKKKKKEKKVEKGPGRTWAVVDPETGERKLYESKKTAEAVAGKRERPLRGRKGVTFISRGKKGKVKQVTGVTPEGKGFKLKGKKAKEAAEFISGVPGKRLKIKKKEGKIQILKRERRPSPVAEAKQPSITGLPEEFTPRTRARIKRALVAGMTPKQLESQIQTFRKSQLQARKKAAIKAGKSPLATLGIGFARGGFGLEIPVSMGAGAIKAFRRKKDIIKGAGRGGQKSVERFFERYGGRPVEAMKTTGLRTGLAVGISGGGAAAAGIPIVGRAVTAGMGGFVGYKGFEAVKKPTPRKISEAIFAAAPLAIMGGARIISKARFIPFKRQAVAAGQRPTKTARMIDVMKRIRGEKSIFKRPPKISQVERVAQLKPTTREKLTGEIIARKPVVFGSAAKQARGVRTLPADIDIALRPTLRQKVTAGLAEAKSIFKATIAEKGIRPKLRIFKQRYMKSPEAIQKRISKKVMGDILRKVKGPELRIKGTTIVGRGGQHIVDVKTIGRLKGFPYAKRPGKIKGIRTTKLGEETIRAGFGSLEPHRAPKEIPRFVAGAKQLFKSARVRAKELPTPLKQLKLRRIAKGEKALFEFRYGKITGKAPRKIGRILKEPAVKVTPTRKPAARPYKPSLVPVIKPTGITTPSALKKPSKPSQLAKTMEISIAPSPVPSRPGKIKPSIVPSKPPSRPVSKIISKPTVIPPSKPPSIPPSKPTVLKPSKPPSKPKKVPPSRPPSIVPSKPIIKPPSRPPSKPPTTPTIIPFEKPTTGKPLLGPERKEKRKPKLKGLFKRKTKYQPSLVGLEIGKPVTKIPKFVTGFGIRKPLRKRTKKKRRRKKSLFGFDLGDVL